MADRTRGSQTFHIRLSYGVISRSSSPAPVAAPAGRPYTSTVPSSPAADASRNALRHFQSAGRTPSSSSGFQSMSRRLTCREERIKRQFRWRWDARAEKVENWTHGRSDGTHDDLVKPERVKLAAELEHEPVDCRVKGLEPWAPDAAVAVRRDAHSRLGL